MGRFKQYVEARTLGLQQPPSVGRAVANTLGRVAFGAIPFVGALSDLVYGAKEVYQTWKSGKNVKGLLLKMMEIEDQMRQPGQKNVFDLNDNISTALSPEAKSDVADMMIKELERIQFNPQAMPDNLANRCAINYMQQIIQQAGI